MFARKLFRIQVALLFILTITIPFTTVSAAFPDAGTYKVTIISATADSIYSSSYPASYAIDGNTTTRWASNEATGGKKWLLLQLDGYHNVVGLRFKDYTGPSIPYKFDAQYAYDDGADHWGNLCISSNLIGDFGAGWRYTPDLRLASVPVRTNKILLKQWGTSALSNTMSVIEVEVYATSQNGYTDLLSTIKLPQQPKTAETVFNIYHRTIHPLMRNDLQPGFLKTDIEPHYTGCYFSVDVVTETPALADLSSVGFEQMKNTLRLIKDHMGPNGEVWDGINENGSTWEKETLTSIDGTRTLRPMQYCGELEFIKLVYWVTAMERDHTFLNEMIQPCRNAWNYVQGTYNATYGMYRMHSHWFDNILREGYDTMGQAWAYLALRDLAEMETTLGNTANADNYNGKADSLKSSFKTHMVKPDGNINEYKQSNGVNRNHGHITGDTLPMAIYSGILNDTDRSAAYNWLSQYASGLYQYPGMTHGRYIPGWTTDIPTDYQNDELMRGYGGSGEAPESWKCTISNPSAYWAVCKAFAAMGNGSELAKITGYMNTLYESSFNSCNHQNAADTKYFYERYDCGWSRSDSNSNDMGPDSEWRYSRYGTDYINIAIHGILGIERTLVPNRIYIKPCVPSAWYDSTGFGITNYLIKKGMYLSFDYKNTEVTGTLTDTQTAAGSQSIGISIPPGIGGQSIIMEVNGAQVAYSTGNNLVTFDIPLAGTYTFRVSAGTPITPSPSPTPTSTSTPTPTPDDLALNKIATASAYYGAGYEVPKGVDGNDSTRWASGTSGAGEWYQVDLGSLYTVNQVTIKWEAAYAVNYNIMVSTDGTSFTTVKTVTGAAGGTTNDTFTAANARYVKINLTGYRSGYNCFSFWTLSVYGTPVIDLALNKTVTASAYYGAGYEVAKGVDGNDSTRWASGTSGSGEWYRVDLGSSYSISKVTIKWEAAYAVNYNITVSTDGTNFTTVKTVTGAAGGTTNDPFTATNARYVKINLTGYRSGYNCFSFWSLSVYQ